MPPLWCLLQPPLECKLLVLASRRRVTPELIAGPAKPPLECRLYAAALNSIIRIVPPPAAAVGSQSKASFYLHARLLERGAKPFPRARASPGASVLVNGSLLLYAALHFRGCMLWAQRTDAAGPTPSRFGWHC